MRVVPQLLRSLAVAIIAFAAGLGIADAQVTETRGTMSLTEGRRYMVAFPQVWASLNEKPNNPAMMLYISSKFKAKIKVETPAGIARFRINRNYDVLPNQILQVPIAESYMSTESEAREGFGISVTSDKPISVFTYQSWLGNGELARHLPTEAWGKNYYTMNFYQDRYGISTFKYRPSQILIIAEKDNTIVTYTPTFDTEGGRETPSVPKGSSQTITMERGETFLIKAKINEALNKEFTTDLSGTLIRASKNIGVVSGHTKVAIMRYPDALPPTGGYAAEAHFIRNNVHDAMLPMEMAGKSFVTVPAMYTATRVTGRTSYDIGIDDDKGDVIRVIALENNTVVRAMRSNGDGLLNKWTINRGETRLETSVDVAVYWESDKPILMGQYGKSFGKVIPYGGIAEKPALDKNGEAVQGYPTIEGGMPMLEYVPSTDRWVNYGTFKSPEGMDNFFNITFKESEIGKIKVDGKSLMSGFGGSMRQLAGTPYSYIRTAIGQGDHVVESTDENVKWMAWTYGSLDGLKQGRAYGTPISIDLAIPCPDSLVVTENIVCGDVTGVGKIVPENIPCGSIFAVYADELTNYELVVDENFSSGDQKVNFWVNVLDKSQDAKATVRVVTRSGKFVEKVYTYEADKIAFDPASINFGIAPFNTPVTREFTITNRLTTRAVTVKELRAKYFPNVFNFTPASFTIPPSGSQKVTVTARIQDAREKIDTVIAVLSCFEQNTVELIIRGQEPVIYVGDQTWVNVPITAGGQEKDVVIQNGSDVDLVITGYDKSLLPLTNDGVAKFYNPVNLDKMPITLKGGEKYTFKVTYNPQGDAVNQHRIDVPFYSNAVRVDSIATLIGNGVSINLAAVVEPWNVRVLDNVQSNQGITEYPQSVRFYNYGSQPVEFNQPTIRGADAAAFRIVNIGDVGTFPIQLAGGGPNESRYITVAFVPTELPNRAAERNNYQAELVFTTNSTETPEVAIKLSAVAWQPQVKGADYDFGSFQTGAAPVLTTIPITNENYNNVSNPTTGDTRGTRNVVLTDIRWSNPADPDNARFTFGTLPTVANPWRIGTEAGAQEQLRVTFTPDRAGTFEAKYDIITQPADMTDGAAPYVATYTLKAVVAGGDFSVTNANVEQYVFLPKDMFITVRHDDAATKRFTIGLPSGTDGPRFTVVDPSTGYIDVPPGQAGIVRIEFYPDYVTKMKPGQTQQWLNDKGGPVGVSYRGTSFQSEVLFTDEATGKTQTAQLTGDGIYLETTNFIRSDYTVKVGESVIVDVQLSPDPESVNQPRLDEMRVRIAYDGKLIRPYTDLAGTSPIILDGTLMQGWNIKSFTQAGVNGFEVDFEAGPNGQPLVDDPNKPLFRVKFDAFLNTSSNPSARFESPLTPTLYWVDVNENGDEKRYTVFRDIPGKLAVTLDCAGQLRLVSLSTARFSVKPVSPNPVSGTAVINYSIGLDGQTSIVLMNSGGVRVADLVNEQQVRGEYELTFDVSNIPSGVYYYQVISGPYTSEPQMVVVVK